MAKSYKLTEGQKSRLKDKVLRGAQNYKKIVYLSAKACTNVFPRRYIYGKNEEKQITAC